ncbi:hypothetical protein DFH05DRAFT_1456002 [Lentinula detonsa]|uniref:Uncharacterized protein n=1 Tax=Lentinula detonsa TaxID=2804962 RepID=A0A9W8U3A7_9AGAR|nr:hypothetical protein DFH05DRAFT_1456002 [Lentinula detonsa]KAJ3983244.1 hypothetical protein F5890DRAFT_1475508 [Lentinula detonsa]
MEMMVSRQMPGGTGYVRDADEEKHIADVQQKQHSNSVSLTRHRNGELERKMRMKAHQIWDVMKGLQTEGGKGGFLVTFSRMPHFPEEYAGEMVTLEFIENILLTLCGLNIPTYITLRVPTVWVKFREWGKKYGSRNFKTTSGIRNCFYRPFVKPLLTAFIYTDMTKSINIFANCHDSMQYTMGLSQALIFSSLDGIDDSDGLFAIERWLRYIPSWFPLEKVKIMDTVPFEMAVDRLKTGLGTSIIVELAVQNEETTQQSKLSQQWESH